MVTAVKRKAKPNKTRSERVTWSYRKSILAEDVADSALSNWLNRADLKEAIGKAEYDVPESDVIETLRSLIEEAGVSIRPNDIVARIEQCDFRQILPQWYGLAALYSDLFPLFTRTELQDSITKFRHQQLRDRSHLIETGYSTFVPQGSNWLYRLFGHLLQTRFPVFTQRKVTHTKRMNIRYIWQSPETSDVPTAALLSRNSDYLGFSNGYGITKNCCLELAPGVPIEPLSYEQAPTIDGIDFQTLCRLELLREPLYRVRQKVLGDAQQAMLSGNSSISKSVVERIKDQVQAKEMKILLQNDKLWYDADDGLNITLTPLLYNETHTPGSLTSLLLFAYLFEHELMTGMLDSIKRDFPMEISDGGLSVPAIRYRTVWEIPAKSKLLTKLAEIAGRMHLLHAEWPEWYRERKEILLERKVLDKVKSVKSPEVKKGMHRDFIYNTTYRSVKIRGQSFNLTPLEAQVTKFLHEQWQNGTPEQSLVDIFIHLNRKYQRKAGRNDNRSRFRDVFRNKEATKALFKRSPRGYWQMNL